MCTSVQNATGGRDSVKGNASSAGEDDSTGPFIPLPYKLRDVTVCASDKNTHLQRFATARPALKRFTIHDLRYGGTSLIRKSSSCFSYDPHVKRGALHSRVGIYLVGACILKGKRVRSV